MFVDMQVDEGQPHMREEHTNECTSLDSTVGDEGSYTVVEVEEVGYY